jgi:hypothetical protein
MPPADTLLPLAEIAHRLGVKPKLLDGIGLPIEWGRRRGRRARVCTLAQAREVLTAAGIPFDEDWALRQLVSAWNDASPEQREQFMQMVKEQAGH